MRRALLLGNPGDGLTGVHADIETMTTLLVRHAFAVDDIFKVVDGDRATILRALREFTATTHAGDVAVLYYSGHGWQVGEFQGICPADVKQTTAADFRGILADELTARVDELTEKTANVTVILDCCHATDIVRGGPSAGVRALPIPWRLSHDELLAALAAQGLASPRCDPETNPLAVHLFACRPSQQASEEPRALGGLLTRALAAVLAECDHEDIVWEDLGRRVDARVRAIKPGQSPVVVGPARRYLFSLETRASAPTTACFTRDEAVWISGGALLDHRPGDRFIALAPVADAPARARLEVLHVCHQLARATSTASLPDGTTVQQVAWASPRAAVALSASPARRARIAAVLCADGRLTLAPASVPTIAEVHETPSGLEIRDPHGAEIRPAAPLEQTCVVLARMAQAAALRRLGTVAPLDPDVWDIAWSFVDATSPLVADKLVRPDAHITATVRNHGSFPLFVTLFAVEHDGRITLLTRSQPNGVELMPGATYRLGADNLHGVRGVPLCGPSLRPRPSTRHITLLAIVCESPVPLGAWEVAPLGPVTRGESTPAAPPANFPEYPTRYDITALDLRIAP